jgi:hypothetical protein
MKGKTKYSFTFERDLEKDYITLTYNSGNYYIVFPKLYEAYVQKKMGISIKHLSPFYLDLMKKRLFWYEEIHNHDVFKIFYSKDGQLKFEQQVGLNTMVISEKDNPSNNICVNVKDIREPRKMTVKRMQELRETRFNKDNSIPLQKVSGQI